MDMVQAIWLAVIQGLSEFLPISSSAHLILPSQILGWPDQGLAFDVAVHVEAWVASRWQLRRASWPGALFWLLFPPVLQVCCWVILSKLISDLWQ